MQIVIIKNAFEKSDREVLEVEHLSVPVGQFFDDLTEFKREDYKAIVSGKPVDWDYVPASTDQVIFIHELQGGGGMGTFFSVAVGAALIATGNPVAVGAGISMIAGAVVSKLFTPAIPDMGATPSLSNSKTYSWSGAGNTFGEGTVIPVLFGRHKIGGLIAYAKAAPDYHSTGVASYYNYVVKKKSVASGTGIKVYPKEDVLYFVQAISEGPVEGIPDKSSIRLDDQPIEDLESTIDDFKWYHGTNDANLGEDFDNTERHYNISGVKLNEVDSTYTHTCKDELKKVMLVFSCPSIFVLDKMGNQSKWFVKLKVEIQYEGSIDWNQYKFDYLLEADSRSEVKFNIPILFNVAGKHKIKVTRLADSIADSSGKDYNDCSLVAVIESIPDSNEYRNTAILSAKITATEHLSGKMPDVTAIWEGLQVKDVRDLDAPVAFSRNPANALYAICTNPRFGKNIPVDIENLKELADYCDEEVTYESVTEAGDVTYAKGPRFTLDIYLDQAYELFEIITKIAASCRAIPFWKGDKLIFVIDRESEPTQLFSMGNIIADSYEENYAALSDIPNEMVVEFTDADNDYEKTQITIIDTERNDETVNSNSVNMFGLTNRHMVVREARYAMRKIKAARKSISFKASIDAIACDLGDVILFQHDTPQYGFGGRVKAADNFSVTLDRKVELEHGVEYAIRVKTASGDIYLDTFEHRKKEGQGDIIETDVIETFDSIHFSEGDVYSFGVKGKDSKPFRITSMTRSGDAEIAITAVEYNESVYTEDSSIRVDDTDYSSIEPYEAFTLDYDIHSSPIPVVDNSVTIIPGDKLVPPYVRSISCAEITGTASASGYVDMLINFSPAYINSNPAVWVDYYEVLYTTDPDQGWQVLGKTNNTSQIFRNAVVGTEYFFVVKPHTNFGKTNAPEKNAELRVENSYIPTGLFDVSNNITDFAANMTEQGVFFTWEDSDVGKTYEIHYGEAVIASGVSGNTFLYPKWLDIGTHNFAIYSIDALKNKSDSAVIASIEITAPAPVTSLSATGGYHSMKLTLGYVKEGGFDYVEIWSNTANDLETATMIGTSRTDEFAHMGIGNSDVRYYWAKVKDYIGNYSSWYPAVDGVLGVTDSGSNQILSELEGQISESKLAGDLRSRIDVIDVDNPDYQNGTLQDGMTGSLVQEFSNQQQFLKEHNSSIDAIKEQVDQLMLTDHDPNEAYSAGSYVATGGSTYKAKVDVPAGQNIPVTDTNYWENSEGWVSLIAENASALESTTQRINVLTNDFESHNTSAEAHDGKINLSAQAITGRLALEEGIVDKGVVVMGVEDLSEGLDIKITNAFVDIDAVNGRITQEVSRIGGDFSKLEIGLGEVKTTVGDSDSGLVSEVSQMSNQYTVKFEDINSKKVLAGFGLHADSEQDISEFIVNANKFAVITPNGDSNEYVFYVDGDTGKIGFNADLIAKGSISAEKMVAGSLVVGQGVNSDISSATITDANGNPLAVFNGAKKISSEILEVDTANIKDAAITNAKIGSLAVDSAKIANGAIVNAKIGSLAVDSANIANGAITNVKIDDATITSAKIESIDAGKITSGVIDANRIDAGSITADKLDVDGATFNNVTVTGNIKSAVIDSSYIDVGGVKLISQGGPAYHCSMFVSDYTKNLINGRLITKPFYSPSYYQGYQENRVANYTQNYYIEADLSIHVPCEGEDCDSRVNFKYSLSYSFDQVNWLELDSEEVGVYEGRSKTFYSHNMWKITHSGSLMYFKAEVVKTGGNSSLSWGYRGGSLEVKTFNM